MSGMHKHGQESGHAHEPSAVVHSMVLFGDEALYLAHMASFDPDHANQLIVQVALSSADGKPEDTYREDRRSTGANLYSVKPEAMHLSVLKPGTSFECELHRGNYEEEEDLLVPDVTVTVKEVVVFRPLDPASDVDPNAGRRYLCFGRPGELFAAHEVNRAPSFDQIIPITVDDPEAAKLSFPVGTPFHLSGTDSPTSELNSGDTAEAEFPDASGPNGEPGFHTKFVAGQEIFFDARFLRG